MDAAERLNQFNRRLLALIREQVDLLKKDTGLAPSGIEVDIVNATTFISSSQDFQVVAVRSTFKL